MLLTTVADALSQLRDTISEQRQWLMEHLRSFESEVQTIRIEADKQRDTATSATEALFQLRDRHVLLLREWEYLNSEYKRARVDPEGMKEVATAQKALERRINELTEDHKTLRAVTTGTAVQVQQIVHSRVWQTLIKAGGVLLKLSPRK